MPSRAVAPASSHPAAEASATHSRWANAYTTITATGATVPGGSGAWPKSQEAVSDARLDRAARGHGASV